MHFEVKTGSGSKKNGEQLKRNRSILMDLFSCFYHQNGGEQHYDTIEKRYLSQFAVYYSNGDKVNRKVVEKEAYQEIFGAAALRQFFDQFDNQFTTENLFKDRVFRNFLLFLAIYRPDYFISPVQWLYY